MAETKLNERDAKELETAANQALEALHDAYGTDSEEWQRGYFMAMHSVCDFFGVEHGSNERNMGHVKALRLGIYKHGGACANGGWSDGNDELFVACPEGNWDVKEDNPGLFDLKVGPFGTLRLEPRNGGEGVGPMMGGSYAATRDSRFARMCEELTGHPWHGAVAVHDRYES